MGLEILKILGGIIDRIFDRDQDRKKAKAKAEELYIQGELDNIKAELDARAKVIAAEAAGGWLASSWRPITMLTFVVLIVVDALLQPYGISLIADEVQAEFYRLVQIGLGGYVVGRSAEKSIKAFRKTP